VGRVGLRSASLHQPHTLSVIRTYKVPAMDKAKGRVFDIVGFGSLGIAVLFLLFIPEPSSVVLFSVLVPLTLIYTACFLPKDLRALHSAKSTWELFGACIWLLRSVMIILGVIWIIFMQSSGAWN